MQSQDVPNRIMELYRKFKEDVEDLTKDETVGCKVKVHLSRLANGCISQVAESDWQWSDGSPVSHPRPVKIKGPIHLTIEVEYLAGFLDSKIT